ncbi:glycosyltransferase family 1 protein [Thermoleophilia bacterium SCSIO 60948]|nr:glycosyltransferase family 1 protein [Thermoleophilia bacterium SCSIO 60948]
MRVLFTTRGSSGHLGPLVPFARACQRAGHDVTVAAQEGFAANVERAGLPFEPFDAPDPEAWMPLMGDFGGLDFESAHRAMIGEFFAHLDLDAELPGLEALVERLRPDVIVRETWEFGSTLVAEQKGVPIARVALTTAAVEEESAAIAAPRVDAARRARGLPADPDGERLRRGLRLSVVPEAMEGSEAPFADATHRFRFTAGETSALPDWWPGNADPLVYLTFGSVAAGAHLPFYPRLYRAAIDALGPLPLRLLVTVGDAERDIAELGERFANVHVETWVDHDAVSAAAAAVVCHGGFGSTLGTLAHGKPLVIVPVFSADQWANGEAVARAGAGEILADDPGSRGALDLPSSAVLGALAGAVRRVLEGPARERAEAVATEMRALPPVDTAAPLLASLAADDPSPAL